MQVRVLPGSVLHLAHVRTAEGGRTRFVASGGCALRVAKCVGSHLRFAVRLGALGACRQWAANMGQERAQAELATPSVARAAALRRSGSKKPMELAQRYPTK